MIKEINIKNFALIEDLQFTFNKGFNVIMGETGSGKSNIIDAISIIFGQRVSKDKIRKGSKTAFLSITLDITGEEKLNEYLKSLKLYEEDEYLIISRFISLDQSTLSKVNDINVTAKVLKEIGSYLIDIYGQFENILILSNTEQLKFLDNIGDQRFHDLLKEYSLAFSQYQNVSKEYEEFLQSPEEINRNIEFLEYQIKEIEDSNILNLNEEEIFKSLDLIENAQEIKKNGQESLNLLNEENFGVLNSLSKIEVNMEKLSEYDDKYSQVKDRVSSAYIELDDISSEIYNLLINVEFDDEEYYDLNNKRDTIFEMKRKYGKSIEEINNFYDESLNQLISIKNYEDKVKELELKKNNLYEKAYNLAKEISKLRKGNGKTLEKSILNQLKDLNMKDSQFKIDFNTSELNKYGIDSVKYLVSFNKNEDLMELSKVASGGEISRFMLAIKSIEANIDKTPILIFDEIDTGISGNAGNVVGYKLRELSEDRILISVSHLPQIIAMADYQYLVYKDSSSEAVSSNLKKLNPEERVVELAKVIQGNNYNEKTLETAKEMINENRSK